MLSLRKGAVTCKWQPWAASQAILARNKFVVKSAMPRPCQADWQTAYVWAQTTSYLPLFSGIQTLQTAFEVKDKDYGVCAQDPQQGADGGKIESDLNVGTHGYQRYLTDSCLHFYSGKQKVSRAQALQRQRPSRSWHPNVPDSIT